MCIYYIHYSPYLKCEGCWLSCVLGIWNIPLHRPTIVSKHSCASLSLVPLFQDRNILVETFPCSSLTAPRLSGKKSRWESKKCILRDILHPISWYDCNSSPTFSRGLYDFLKKKKFTKLLNDFHADFSIWLSGSSKFPSQIKALIWGPTKIPSLILESLTRGNFTFK